VLTGVACAVRQVWNGRERVRRLCAAAEAAMGDNAVKEEGAAAAAHTQLSAARDLVAAGSSSNAVPTTPAALEACADGLCKAVAAAFGGDGKVPRASGWNDAKAAPGKGDGWIKSDVELCAPAPTQPFPPKPQLTRAHGAGLGSRPFERGTALSARIGGNDKTRLTVRLAPSADPPPAGLHAPPNPLPTILLLNSRCCPAAAGAAEGGGEDTAAVPPEARAKSMVESSLLRSYVTQQLGGGAQKKRARPAEASHDSDDDDAPRHAPPPPPPPPRTP